MKKLLIWLLSLIFIISLFPGCSNNTQSSSHNSSNISSSQSSKNTSSSSSNNSSDNSNSSLSSNLDNISSDIQPSENDNQNNNTSVNKNPSKKDSDKSANNKADSSQQSSLSNQSQAPYAPNIPAASSQTPASVSEPAEQTPDTITVTLSVDCKTAVAQGNDIAQAISQNGYILSGKQITLDTGATVYDALKKSGLIIGANSSATGTYIYSIQSLAEKACGSKSGWIYYVNGAYISKSCSKYKLNDGDTISWRYTCDNGNDL